MSATAASPAAGKKAAGRQGTAPPTAPAVPSRAVSFVTVGANGYSQLFATNCLSQLFLAAVASELTHHIAQRVQSNLTTLTTQQQQHTTAQPQPQSTESEAGSDQSDEKQPLSSTDSAYEQQLQQWQAEHQQLVDRQLQYEAALDVLCHTTDEECVFDVRDASTGVAVKLFEHKETRVKDVLAGAGKYELLVARKKQDTGSLSFHPLQMPV